MKVGETCFNSNLDIGELIAYNAAAKMANKIAL
jgi:hypothetical protein